MRAEWGLSRLVVMMRLLADEDPDGFRQFLDVVKAANGPVTKLEVPEQESTVEEISTK